ncbi:type IV pilus twitching motility protein PilT [Moraxella nasovis]|uniref:type IV pilus twitching motility protein PilT n=1 Tax=Moraxella nasovis TaxID=2904121 RepID=UPI001F610A9A|nr:type IV pilus twitching motility protein PilT [Moraxella nasovis]UNU73737.1 type IV pilus twitching motility protein PilT [Moraxella nasovis]
MTNTPNLNQLLAFVTHHHASDLHLSTGEPPIMRIDGQITRTDLPPLSADAAIALIKASMSDGQFDEFCSQKELDYALQIPQVGRFRVNAFTHHRGVAAVFRHIPDSIPTLASLSFGAVFEKIATLSQGLVLITGATGSGKSTTLAAIIDHINHTQNKHILTIEDPIEFIHHAKYSLISQREVKRDTASFEQALKSALREDPDVILVGELRDLASIRLALTAAETGHLVLGTLHTASAVKTIDRIVDVFNADDKAMIRTMLSESLQAVVSQSLLPKVGGGRIAAHEILISTPAIRHMIREHKLAQIHSAMQTGLNQGMTTLDQALAKLVNQGLISQETSKIYTKDIKL